MKEKKGRKVGEGEMKLEKEKKKRREGRKTIEKVGSARDRTSARSTEPVPGLLNQRQVY